MLARRVVYAALAHRGPPNVPAAALLRLARERHELMEAAAAGARGGVVDVTNKNPDADLALGSDAAPREGTALGKRKEREEDVEEVEELHPLCEGPLDVEAALKELASDLEAARYEYGLLANVYVPYWERRVRDFEQMGGILCSPAFVCPECGNAI